MTVDKALIDKVKGLTSPSNEIDQEVWLAIGSPSSLLQHVWFWSSDPTSTWRPDVYRFTESVDHSIRLLREVLPEWVYVIDGMGEITVRLYPIPDSLYFYQGTGSTPAIAFLVAILTALESRK